MPAACPPEFAGIAHALADASGRVIRRYFRAPLAVDDKDDASPVTVADREAERAIRELLAEKRPGDGVIGEEFGSERADAEFVWVIDPIDGTKSFLAGRPIFGTLIAATRRGVPVLGVIDQPVSGERWIARRGAGAAFNGGPIAVRDCPRLGEAVVATTSPRLFTPDGMARFETVEKAAKHAVFGGDCYNYGLLAMGRIDVVVESGLKPHDFCALAPVVEEAGGTITDWSGRPLDAESGGDVAAAGDARLHREVLGLLGG